MTTLDGLLTWRESSTTAEAIDAALDAAREGSGDARELLAGADRIVVTGAGSSFYLAQTVAAAARETMRRPVMATPLSELILRPEAVLVAPSDDEAAARREPVVIISRSGATSEAVTVAERMRAARHPTIAVTCRLDSPLADQADVTLVSPGGDEAAIVMTRSFASMLALLLWVVARVGADDELASDLGRLPDRWDESSAAATDGTAPRGDRLEPRRHPWWRTGVRDRRRVGPEADRDQPGGDRGVRAAGVPPRTDLRV